ncbi:hypothetical protein O4H49_12940 [Kiloniella laminariae]|uniref:HTH cro/C1-type domain-containing protein n=1 Tax=Kiloniella laminariae TaxID=454162 RepID=A0ABT4LKQ3_9PROT|nr:hypothetical protein [Kiloniella laminariae]MCZ4281689.1 hypothetical protein [Kiloniella laminariae]
MTDVEKLRKETAKFLGLPRLSQSQFGAIIGLKPDNARTTIMRWEKGKFEPSGPSILVFVILKMAIEGKLDSDTLRQNLLDRLNNPCKNDSKD